MTDPRNAIQTGIYTALNAAGITALVDPTETDSFPYTVFGGGTLVQGPLTTKTGDGGEIVHTLVSWATSPTTAQSNASIGMNALTDRNAPITATGYNIILNRPEFGGEIIRDASEPDSILFGVPYRVRIVVEHQ
jgi:hypothetical protein|tara:strand:- start:270 stop:671 length:402 start_codon:yes stop_codon:yes gene_type:complete